MKQEETTTQINKWEYNKLLYYYSHSKLIFCKWKHHWRAC